jgi:hypothetical protein
MSKKPVTFWGKVVKEIKSILAVTLYFALWLGVLMFLKKLMLEDYNIEFSGVSIALISALIMAKVVLLMELIKLGSWVERQPAIVDIIIRTLLYSIGVLFVSLLEKAFEARHEEGGFGKALSHVFQHRDIYKVWAGTLVVGLSLFFFNVFSILQQKYSEHELAKVLFSTPLKDIKAKNSHS